MTAATPTPVFVNCRDRLECLRALLDWLERAGYDEIYLIDNDSRYEPLLEFYERSPHKIIYLGRNVGRLSLFVIDELKRLCEGRRFIYTDPDVVPIEGCPLDILLRLTDLLDRYPEVDKVGLGLKIDDIPQCYDHRKRVLKIERPFWKVEVEPGVFRAPIDTTFALYRRGTTEFSLKALRTGHPYLARHLTWYADSQNPTAEERFYNERVSHDTPDSPMTSGWSGGSLHPELIWRTSPHLALQRLRSRVLLRTRLRSLLHRR